ncbi:hypothetical protein LIER_00316 [Lithospermum erythrorhizon]|uniref:Pentatricopeptide repeat-containing protein n=1 Tax=Lithospermum erythrorhizon TaxID=34254 RepID=A0AAV3NKJ7_LITER
MNLHLTKLLPELSKPHQTLPKTQKLHALIAKSHHSDDPFYATKLIRFYALNNDLISAHNLFDKTPQRTTFLWNSIIRAYARNGFFSTAFSLFKDMFVSQTKPDNFTFACMLRASEENGDVEGVRSLHGVVVVVGLGLDSVCCSALVSVYSKAGRVLEASKVFLRIMRPDLVLFNAMIMGYALTRDWVMSLEFFRMMQKYGEPPDGYTMVGLITCFGDPSLLAFGEGIHGICIRKGFDSSDHVSSALLSMYFRCKCVKSARKLFDGVEQPDLVTSSALITGFVQSEDYVQAFDYFRAMNVEGLKADHVLIASILAACAQLTIVGPGSEVHGYVIRHGCEEEVMVASALIYMYAKCGFLEMGLRVFRAMPRKNIVTYNLAINNFGLYGFPSEAFRLFDELIDKGLKPDETTFTAVLCACCHAGLLNLGREYYRRMKHEFGIQTITEHYVHMVKLLGMAGELEEAYELVRSLQEPIDPGIWGALLMCCDVHRNFELADIVAQRLLHNKTEKSSYKVMLSNLYAAGGRWNDVEKLRVDEGSQRKLPGVSWISGA